MYVVPTVQVVSLRWSTAAAASGPGGDGGGGEGGGHGSETPICPDATLASTSGRALVASLAGVDLQAAESSQNGVGGADGSAGPVVVTPSLPPGTVTAAPCGRPPHRPSRRAGPRRRPLLQCRLAVLVNGVTVTAALMHRDGDRDDHRRGSRDGDGRRTGRRAHGGRDAGDVPRPGPAASDLFPRLPCPGCLPLSELRRRPPGVGDRPSWGRRRADAPGRDPAARTVAGSTGKDPGSAPYPGLTPGAPGLFRVPRSPRRPRSPVTAVSPACSTSSPATRPCPAPWRRPGRRRSSSPARWACARSSSPRWPGRAAPCWR